MSTSHPSPARLVSRSATKPPLHSPTKSALTLQIAHTNTRAPTKRPRVSLPFDTDNEDTTTALSPFERHKTARRFVRLSAASRRATRPSVATHPTRPATQPSPPPPPPPHSQPRRRRLQPLSLWQQLSDAQLTLEARPRPDARFVSDMRPLDLLHDLRASIALTLFPDGYVRHDWTLDASNLSHSLSVSNDKSSVKPTVSPPALQNIASLARYPYDRYSRAFLLSLDLGFIPPLEDLPDLDKRYYYDGCLIAELRDKRFPGQHAQPSRRILLRPHMATLYDDLDLLTRDMSRSAALQTEQLLLRFTSRNLHLNPCLHPALCANNISAAYSVLDAFQGIRMPKRRRIQRPPGPPVLPSLSAAALLLIAASEKQLTLQRNATCSQRISLSENAQNSSRPSTSSTHSSAGASSTPTRSPSDSIPTKQEPQIAHNLSTVVPAATVPSRRRHIMPPEEILNTAIQNSRSSQSAPSQQSASSLQMEFIRIVLLILPDRQSAAQLQKVQAQAQAQAGSSKAIASEQVKAQKHQTLINMNKTDKQVYILQMNKKVAGGYEIVVHHGVFNIKARDTYRVQLSSVEEGHAYLEQFKKITKREGYYCMQDGSPASVAPAMQQQLEQQNTLPSQRQPAQKQSAKTIQQRQTNSASPRHSPAQQAHKPYVAQGTAHTMVQPHAADNSQSAAQHNQKQKQLQLQRQQQLQQRKQQQQMHQQQQFQTEQMIRQQLQQQQHIQIRHHPQQNLNRARIQQQQQLQRHARGNVGIAQAATVAPASMRAAGQVAPNRMGNITTAAPMARPGTTSAAMNSAAMVTMGNNAMLGRNQVLTPAQLQQHFHQMHTQQQQLRVQEHQRNLIAGATGVPAGASFGNAVTGQQLQNRTLSAAMGNRRPNVNARSNNAAGMNGADALTHQRIQQHFKQQREDVEEPSRATKR